MSGLRNVQLLPPSLRARTTGPSPNPVKQDPAAASPKVMTRCIGYSDKNTFEQAPASCSNGAGKTGNDKAAQKTLPKSSALNLHGAGSMKPEELQRLMALLPSIERHAHANGVNPQTLAAIMRTESNFINHQLHKDGHGHGLVGLDDRGSARGIDFEKKTKISLGRGPKSNVVNEDAQIKYLAQTLKDSQRRYGNEAAAIREWHRGDAARNDAAGYAYLSRVEENRQEIIKASKPQPPR